MVASPSRHSVAWTRSEVCAAGSTGDMRNSADWDAKNPVNRDRRSRVADERAANAGKFRL
jgi:hypothetical protein